MSLDRRKGLQAAERLLRQGKLKDALDELQRISASAPNDMLTLNRLGDLLARQGRHAEAIGYYRKIADQFADGGFLPKAIAIHKKILRLDPQRLDSIAQLGRLYLRQNLHGEARNYLLHAANQHVENREFAQARAIYEDLVTAEPNDPRHRVRLAETRGAEGDRDGAVAELVRLGDSVLADGKAADAEKIYRRALELDAGAAGAVLGVASCAASLGRADESLDMLEKAARGGAGDIIKGELALRYAAVGRFDEMLQTLDDVTVSALSLGSLRGIVGACKARGRVDDLWARLDPAIETESAGPDPAPLADFLEQASELEPEGHLPALERLARLQERRSDTPGRVRALEWLVRVYEARNKTPEAKRTRETLLRLAPQSAAASAPAQARAASATASIEVEPTAHAPAPAAASSASAAGPVSVPLDAEAPAVPLNRADEEFVAGRLTQAEVLEKYGLHQQAVEQVQEVTAKFPGYVQALESLVTLIEGGSDGRRLGACLVQLALARRAAGDTDGAREAASRANEVAPLPAESAQVLAGLELIPATDRPAVPAAAPPAAAALEPDGDEFDLSIELSEPAAATPAAPPAPPVAEAVQRGGRPTREPSADMLQEIRDQLAIGNGRDAQRKIDALYTLGYASEALEELAARVANAVPPPTPGETPVAASECAAPIAEDETVIEGDDVLELTPADDESADLLLDDGSLDGLGMDDEDLSAITAALENELFDPASDPVVPEEKAEESLDDIFATFKEHVAQEVGAEDYRTHYDLGIAYKEMGLTREAIAEFEVALKADDLFREACSMIALCHRELSETDEAIRWYRQAIGATDGEPDALNGLRYDLADLLSDSGDTEAALEMFRDVSGDDPGYRDVGGRISELEAQLTV